MSLNPDRRRFLHAGLGGAAMLALPGLSARAATPPVPLATTRLGEQLLLITGAGGNIVAARDADGLLLVDGGTRVAGPAALKLALRELGARRAHTLVNTHWHPEQTGSNEAFGKAGAQIIAHEKTKQRLSIDLYRPAIDRYVKALPVAGRPTKSFFTKETLQAGGETLELGYLLEAHTDGDCYVHFRNANVVAAGDAVSPERDPVLDWYGGGWIGGRIDAIDALLKLGNDATRYVPAQGGVVTRAQLATERAFLDGAYTRMTDLLRKGYSAKDMLDADVFKGLPRTLADPQAFAKDAFKGLWAHHNTISHDIV